MGRIRERGRDFALRSSRDLRALPSVDRVMSIRYVRPEYNGTVVYLIALDAVDYARATRADLEGGSSGRLNRIAKSLAKSIRREVEPAETIDIIAQAAACAAPILAAAPVGRVAAVLGKAVPPAVCVRANSVSA